MKDNSAADDTIQTEWTAAIERHRAAIADYLQIAARLDEQVWRLPVGAEKWTPAQITDHLIRTYNITLEQLRGGQGIKTQYGFLLRQVLRLAVLSKIYRTRELPRGAKAPEEILPKDSKTPRETALEQLKELSGEFENEILSGRNNKKLRLTHHVFGEIRPLKAIDFVAIHTEHHTRQLPQS